MGIETAIIVALSVATADAALGQADDQAAAVVAKANIEAANKGKQVRAKAARAKVSFLNSGLTLEGTPINALTDIFDTGLEDISLIRENADRTSKNIVSKARTDAILGLAKTGIGATGGAGGLESIIGNASGFQFGAGGFGGIPFGGFEGQTGVSNPFVDPFSRG